jgi:hypothetical protein
MKKSELKLLKEVNECVAIYVTFTFWNIDCQIKSAKREFEAMKSLAEKGLITIAGEQYLGKFDSSLGKTYKTQYTLMKVV